MKEWYDKNYFEHMFRGACYRPMLKSVSKAVMSFQPKTVLDVGCGHGILVKRLLNNGIQAWGVDFSDFAGSEIPERFIQTDAKVLPFADQSFDVVVSTDFFEHLPEEEIDIVFNEMKRVGKNIVARIGFKPDNERHKSFPIDTHLTVKPKEWWQKKLPGVLII